MILEDSLTESPFPKLDLNFGEESISSESRSTSEKRDKFCDFIDESNKFIIPLLNQSDSSFDSNASVKKQPKTCKNMFFK